MTTMMMMMENMEDMEEERDMESLLDLEGYVLEEEGAPMETWEKRMEHSVVISMTIRRMRTIRRKIRRKMMMRMTKRRSDEKDFSWWGGFVAFLLVFSNV